MKEAIAQLMRLDLECQTQAALIAVLEAALRDVWTFARHAADCDAVTLDHPRYNPCSCGLDDIRRRVIEKLPQKEPTPRNTCRAPAPDRSGRQCDKPHGHTGDHWTYGGATLTWQEPTP